MSDVIDSPDVRCLSCTYCLKGLPVRGRCPECGGQYVAEGPEPAEAARRFNAVLPPHWRFWMSADVERTRSGAFLFLLVILAAALSAAVFVLLQYLAVRLASPHPWGRSPEHNEFISTIFGEVGCGWAKPRPWDGGGPYLWAIAACGQVFLALVIRFWYAVSLRRPRPHRRIATSFGNLAMGSIWPALSVPMFLVVAWQFWNVSRPTWGGGHYFDSLQPLFLFGMDQVRPVNLAASVILYVGAVLGAALLRRRHRRCIAKVGDALTGVRLASDDAFPEGESPQSR